ncbi:MAG: TonB-dependent receptor [Cytophagales bacterium]|nr:TonB-dependent receptor [Cytophagales bacterium]
MLNIKYFLLIPLISLAFCVWAQTGTVKGKIMVADAPATYINIGIPKLGIGTTTDSSGSFALSAIPYGKHTLLISGVGIRTHKEVVNINSEYMDNVVYIVVPSQNEIEEVVVTGTMKEMNRLESAIPVEVITPRFFQKNPTPNLFEAVGMLNGVQPQLNCNVCNTGDIHINGMEGPYTMVLIDGMPIVSALSTVYGLMGVPNSIVERIEVVKGPAAALYGSEAMGGIINIITKNPSKAARLSADIMGTSWGEYNADISAKYKIGNSSNLLGVNYYNYQNTIDNNKDGFTDMTLQNRVSVFNKWSLERKNARISSLAARVVYEDRWGGQDGWTNKWRGTDSVYGESIITKRIELIGMYQLPISEKIITQYSFNWHNQDSYYGTTPYMATQHVGFAQAYWEKKIGLRHNILLGTSVRYTIYDDNSPATAEPNDTSITKPAITPLPGVFAQDEWGLTEKLKVLLGYRYDYDKYHGSINSPRAGLKYSFNKNNIIRGSFGTGFRVVNLFTEDHAALTGAREVVITSQLNPERSYNGVMNYVLKLPFQAVFIGLDMTAFYTYFTNKIVGDFDTDPNKIIYDNISGHAVSRGVSLNQDMVFNFPLKIMAGITYMEVYVQDNNLKTDQLQAPKWSGNFTASYTFAKPNISLDFTGRWYGPMRLPILPNDYRPEYSPLFCIANIQVTKKWKSKLEVYGGVKNMFDFVPKYPIMRPFDPFDKNINDPVSNPNGYTFDPNYNYSSLQGIRMFAGVRYLIN